MEVKSVSTKRGNKPPWQRTFVQGGGLLLIWLLFSGKFDVFHIGTGVVAVFFVLWLDRKLGSASLEDARVPLRARPLRILAYVPWLLWQMILSSLEVARVILSPKRANPALITFRTPQPHVIAKVVLGNSITLTPGTLTLDIAGDRFLIHSLSETSTASLLDGTMQRKVARMFSEDPAEPVVEPKVFRDRYYL